MDLYPLIRKLGSNAYVLDWPDNLGICYIFNVENLTLRQGTFDHPCLPLSAYAGITAPQLPPFPHSHTDVG